MASTQHTEGQAPWTPFDHDIEQITVGSFGPTLAQSATFRELHCLRDGYLEAVGRYTPLLAAAKAMTDWADGVYLSKDNEAEAVELITELRAAIAAAEPQEVAHASS